MDRAAAPQRDSVWRRARFIIRDREHKFGADFDRAEEAVGAHVIKTPVRTPNMNATRERFLGSVRPECLVQIIVLSQRHLFAVLTEYARCFNLARPHQGLRQGTLLKVSPTSTGGEVLSLPVLGGLHNDYRRAA